MLEERWEEYEYLRCKLSDGQINFFSWFKKYHAEEVKSTMLCPIRIAAGLGDPSSEFCTNDSEAIYSSIKQFLHFKKVNWPIFNKMKHFVMEQHEEVCKAVIGTGQYSLKKEYESLSVAPSNWYTVLYDEQRKNAKRKFQEACVMSSQILVNDHISQGEEAEKEEILMNDHVS